MSLKQPFILSLLTILFCSCSMSGSAFQDRYDYIVAKDGSGDYESIQGAIDGSKSFPPERITIFIKKGVYHEKVKVHAWNTRMSFIGEDAEKTIITWDDHFDKINRGRNSTFHTYTLLVEGDDFHAESLTIENSAGDVGQAVALHVDSDRVSFSDCKLLGNQDTVYLAGEGNRQYFKNCYIEGTTDFIFGGATAVFEDSQLHSKKNSYITAASTPENQSFGFVFRNTTLTASADIDEVYLGRPWRNYARTVFLESRMGAHIVAQGWHNWNNEQAETTAFYAEFENSGPGYRPQKRVEWSHQLTPAQAENYALKTIFGNWNPEMRMN